MAEESSSVTVEGEEIPVDFKNEEEEAEYLERFTRLRESVAVGRRQSMMPSVSAAPLEFISLMAVNPEVPDAAQKLAKLAGRILGIVSSGVLGASMRPVEVPGYDWVFKVQFRSGDELELFYDQLEMQNDEENLISESVMVSLPRLDGVVAKGTSETVVVLKIAEGVDAHSVLSAVQAVDPAGMIKSSIRDIPAPNAFFDGYASVTPEGYTHVMMLDFDSEESAKEFDQSGALASAYTGDVDTSASPPIVFNYSF